MIRDIGGVLLQGFARPSPDLAADTLTLHYRRAAPDGSRFAVQVGDRFIVTDLYDWELEPIASFADSDYHATVTATASATSLELKVHGDDLREVLSFHPAFQNRLMGIRHLQADYVRELGGQRFLPSLNGQLLLGPGEAPYLADPADTTAAENRIASLLRKMGQSWILLNDVYVDYVFGIEDERFVITGDPYYFLWNPSRNDWNIRTGSARVSGRVKSGKKINKRIRKAWPDYYAMNPLVFRAVTRTARYAALFRYQLEADPDNWEDFISAVIQTTDKGFVLTPTLVADRN